MFYLRTAIKNIRRHRFKNLLSACVCILTIQFLSIYVGNIDSTQNQLQDLADASSILCKVSDYRGTVTKDLFIPNTIMQSLRANTDIRDLQFTINLEAGIGAFTIEQAIGRLDLLVQGVEVDFRNLKENECIISSFAEERYHLNIGDTIPLNLYYYEQAEYNLLNKNPLALASFKIVDVIETNNTSAEFTNVFVPLDQMEQMYKDKGIPFLPSSATFYVSDPLRLNEFKQEMHELGLLSVSPDADDDISENLFALSVNDSVFVSSANALRQRMDILNGLLPFVFAINIFLGYIIPYLLVNSRQLELTTMRTLGVKWRRCFGIFFTEQLIVALGSMVIGCAVSRLYTSFSIVMMVAATFTVFYLLGTVSALIQSSRKPVMELLTLTD